MVLTSNRTRELHDALKRRCLYHWIDYPTPEREAEIVRARLPGVPGGGRRARVRRGRPAARARSSTSCPAWGRRSPGRGRCSRSTATDDLDDTLGRRAEGARGHRPRARGGRAAGCLSAAGRAIAAARRALARARCARARRRTSASASCSPPHRRARRGRRRASASEAFFALRAALCSSHADLDACSPRRSRSRFAARATTSREDPLEQLGEIERAALPRRRASRPRRDAGRGRASTPVPAAWSEEELLREKDFAAYTDAERAVARRLLARLARRGPQRRSRRTRADRAGAATMHDLRATIRASLRHGGELLERRYREPARRPRRLVLVCDVSGSMAPVRADAAAVHAGVRGRPRAGRGVRVRHAADARHARAAPAATPTARSRRAAERGRRLVGRHAHRRGDRRAQPRARPPDRPRRDRRDPALRRLGPRRPRGARPRRWRACAARAHRVVWLNPLAADPRYEPLTRGMQAALPHVDRLLPGNSIASLEALAELMEEGVPHDPP